MKKILCSLLVGIMFISSLSVSAASFTDVKQGDWYYETVTEMTEKGLFNGKGNNLFCPNDTMTKAEFLAVTMRIICPGANLKAENTLAWWQPAYNLAIQTEIIDSVVFPADSMENAMVSFFRMAKVKIVAALADAQIATAFALQYFAGINISNANLANADGSLNKQASQQLVLSLIQNFDDAKNLALKMFN